MNIHTRSIKNIKIITMNNTLTITTITNEYKLNKLFWHKYIVEFIENKTILWQTYLFCIDNNNYMTKLYPIQENDFMKMIDEQMKIYNLKYKCIYLPYLENEYLMEVIIQKIQ